MPEGPGSANLWPRQRKLKSCLTIALKGLLSNSECGIRCPDADRLAIDLISRGVPMQVKPSRLLIAGIAAFDCAL